MADLNGITVEPDHMNGNVIMIFARSRRLSEHNGNMRLNHEEAVWLRNQLDRLIKEHDKQHNL